MIDAFSFVLILSVLLNFLFAGLIYYILKDHKQERWQLIQAVISKDAEELRRLLAEQKKPSLIDMAVAKLDKQNDPAIPLESELVQLSEMDDNQFAKHIEKVNED